MQSEQAPHLLTSLLADARQFASPFDESGDAEPFIAATYQATGNRLAQRPGYPRLYRCAWKLLQQCVAQREWDTLQRVFDVMRVAQEETDWLDTCDVISPWHLKAVLFCWAYLCDARELGQGAEFDAALLERRRSQEDAECMLRALHPLQCFLGQTPQEAHARLEAALCDFERPYLFRLSTTLPGFVTLTLLAPLSKRPLDMRVSPWEAQQLAAARDLYTRLCQRRMHGAHEQTVYGVQAIVELLLRPLEQPRYFDAARLACRLRDVAPPDRADIPSARVCGLLKRAFWNRVHSRQLVAQTAEERVGLTTSYAASYATLNPLQLRARLSRCATCSSGGLQEHVREPLNGQVYCSEQCYATDFRLCY
jgi:hypothetical protein